jgi:hypothetical protein
MSEPLEVSGCGCGIHLAQAGIDAAALVACDVTGGFAPLVFADFPRVDGPDQ